MKRLINTLKYWLEAGIISLFLVFVALILLAYCHPALATPDTDWERQAKQNWIADHGDTPPDLTAESEQYLRQETARMQAERDKEVGK